MHEAAGYAQRVGGTSEPFDVHADGRAGNADDRQFTGVAEAELDAAASEDGLAPGRRAQDQ
jgi:hypothetical protein